MKHRYTITALLFLLLLAGGFVLLVTSFLGREGSFEALLKNVAQDKDVPAFLEQAESAVNEDLDRDHLFIQLYGGVQMLSGRRVIQDMVEDNSVGTQSQPGEDVIARARATAEFADALEASDIPFLYVAAPQKIQRGAELLPKGLEDNGNAYCDAYLAELKWLGVDYIDLRPLF